MALRRLYSSVDIAFFLTGTNAAELDSGSTVVAGLADCGAAVVPSRPSRSMGSSRSIRVGDGKSAIGNSVLSYCRWFSLRSLASDCL